MTRLTIFIGALVILFIVLASLTSYEVPLALYFGWISFLWDVLPRISIDSVTAIFSGIAFLMFLIGIHWIASSFYGRSKYPSDASRNKWSFRWTLTVGILLIVLFASGLSLIGITHQLVWFGGTKQPLLSPSAATKPSRVNLKDIALTVHHYASTMHYLPNGRASSSGALLHSWETQILPFGWYSTKGIDFEKPWNAPENAPYFKCVLREFINPDLRDAALEDAEGFGLSHYAANIHVISAGKGLSISDITDGPGKTILVGEVNANFKPWGYPMNWRDSAKGINKSPNGFGGKWSLGGAHFAMVDGSVRFLSEKTSPQVLKALSTPQGGEEIDIEQVAPNK